MQATSNSLRCKRLMLPKAPIHYEISNENLILYSMKGIHFGNEGGILIRNFVNRIMI